MTQQYYLDDTDVFLFKIIGLTVFFIVAMFITHGIGGLIHEGAHARACIVLGGNLGGFRHWLRGAWSLAPTTDCSIKPLPPRPWSGPPEILRPSSAGSRACLFSRCCLIATS
jgi:hypothetical protein